MGLGRRTSASPTMRTRRIRKELPRLWIDPPAFCRPGASPVTDPFHWEMVIDGPDGSPYAGGTFPVDVVIPRDYPFKPPKLTFKTKVYHPNIDEDGKMFLDIFRRYWSPVFTIDRLLLSVVSVLYDPLLDRPVRCDIARQYVYQRHLFEETARRWTRRYASKPVVSFCPANAGHSSGRDGSGASSIESHRFCSNSATSENDGGVIPLLWGRAVAFLT